MRDLSIRHIIQITTILLLVMSTVTWAAVVGVQRWRRRRPFVAPAARILAYGSAAVIVMATLIRTTRPIQGEPGDLRLTPGLGGLRRGLIDLIELSPTWAAFLVVGNIALYVPLGLFAALGWGGRYRVRALLGCVALSVFIELVQYAGVLGGGEASTDDLLLNSLGAVVGWLIGIPLLASLSKRKPRNDPALRASDPEPVGPN